MHRAPEKYFKSNISLNLNILMYVCVYIYIYIKTCFCVSYYELKFGEKNFPGFSVVLVTDFEMWCKCIATDNPP